MNKILEIGEYTLEDVCDTFEELRGRVFSEDIKKEEQNNK